LKPDFLNKEIDHKEIYLSLQEHGAWYSNGLIKKDYINNILLDFPETINFNSNNNEKVVYHHQKFVSQTFVHSQKTFNLMTNESIQKIFSDSLTSYTIKSARYYETGRGGISLWHQDEINSNYISNGLIFLIYLNEIKDKSCGPFEFIKGSHRHSLNLKNEDFYSKKIYDNYKDKIVSVCGDSGTVIVADSKIIHRARAHVKKFVRKSLFSQVSQVSSGNITYRERILPNPAFLNDKLLQNEKMRCFLGINMENSNHIFPPTSLSDVPFKIIYIKQFLKWALKGIIKKIFESLPIFLKKKLRTHAKRDIDYDSFEGKI